VSGMSPVAADLASADRAPTGALVLVPVVDAEDADELADGADEVFELDELDEPQPAPTDATSEARRIIVMRDMRLILQTRPENLLNACPHAAEGAPRWRILRPR
jgi:hypothetical protein